MSAILHSRICFVGIMIFVSLCFISLHYICIIPNKIYAKILNNFKNLAIYCSHDILSKLRLFFPKCIQNEGHGTKAIKSAMAQYVININGSIACDDSKGLNCIKDNRRVGKQYHMLDYIGTAPTTKNGKVC